MEMKALELKAEAEAAALEAKFKAEEGTKRAKLKAAEVAKRAEFEAEEVAKRAELKAAEVKLEAEEELEFAKHEAAKLAIKAKVFEQGLSSKSLRFGEEDVQLEDPMERVKDYIYNQQWSQKLEEAAAKPLTPPLDVNVKEFPSRQPFQVPTSEAPPPVQPHQASGKMASFITPAIEIPNLPPVKATTPTIETAAPINTAFGHFTCPMLLGQERYPTVSSASLTVNAREFKPRDSGVRYPATSTYHMSQPAPQTPLAYTPLYRPIDPPSMLQNVPSTWEAWNTPVVRNPRRDLADRGVSKFSDQPEDYLLWKTTFQRVMRDMRLLPDEELTLLIAWLGTTSATQVKGIYSAYVKDPVKALQRSWAMLDDRYGASAKIEASLMERLRDFPKLTMKDGKRLWDFADLLLQLESAKDNPELPGLACLDQHITQKEITNKLPFQLKEAWGQEVFAYKESHSQVYPPFAFLVKFVSKMARRRNDSQTGLPDLYQSSRDEGKPLKEFKTPRVISVKKTEIIKAEPKGISKMTPSSVCPIHNTSHSLNQCREFRKKPYSERVAFVKEQGLCFNCCTSKDHMAKECREKVICEDCKSTRHCSAMHRYQRQQGQDKVPSVTPKSSSDVISLTEPKVTSSSCTALCGESEKVRTCHPICLANIFPDSRPEEARKVYVVLDSQSDASLATPEFFDLFGVQSERMNYIMSTCSGDQATAGRVATGFSIQSVHGGKKFELPALVECKGIPRDRKQIPTRSVALHHPHLRPIANEIPELDPDVQILLLLGSDCPDLFHVKRQVKGPPGTPFAQKLELGWAILGTVCPNRKRAPLAMKTFAASLTDSARPTQLEDRLDHGSIHRPEQQNKIVSNSDQVLQAFPEKDRAKVVRTLDFELEQSYIQRSLGLCWDIVNDVFTFKVPSSEKKFTRRGVLSTINSLFDPLGFAAPVVLQGKLLLRDITQETKDWDDPLSPGLGQKWKTWKEMLPILEAVIIPRRYTLISPMSEAQRELHIFSDASEKAIAAVAYLRTVLGTDVHLGFVLGKSRLAPTKSHTIPRLELCAATLAIQIFDLILREFDLDFQKVVFYTDSRVVLGYIHNSHRRFYVYVSNRVDYIHQFSQPKQWKYVPTDQNPADQATRAILAADLQSSLWLKGPPFLMDPRYSETMDETFGLQDPELDKEVRPIVTALAVTTSKPGGINSARFERFSTWNRLISGIARLVHFLQFRDGKPSSVDDRKKAERIVFQSIQSETYSKEIACLKKNQEVHKNSPLCRLNPFLDTHGLLRIGGRLTKAKLATSVKYSVILPAKHYVSLLIARHYHERKQHQGRHLTEGAVRDAGVWIIGMKRLVSKVVFQCVTCKKLRGKCPLQRMADLPRDRLSVQPPFTNVGLDVFGPWTISTRRTRGGAINSKRWAVIFTCLSIRAVHIELIESMDTTSFVNALRRFFAIRGPARIIRSDCGSNFKGACKELKWPERSVLDPNLQDFLKKEECVWLFNPPHASHMGGAWERMIGIARRILDAMLLHTHYLTHEVLSTLMAEVSSIINSRPLVPVSTDVENPYVLSPATLLTFKTAEWKDPSVTTDIQEICKRHWKQVQVLANTFWRRWRQEYLPLLQKRSKWETTQPNLRQGDIVLLKDKESPRQRWPLGIIQEAIPSEDGKVRKLQVRVASNSGNKVFERPISDVVFLHRDIVV